MELFLSRGANVKVNIAQGSTRHNWMLDWNEIIRRLYGMAIGASTPRPALGNNWNNDLNLTFSFPGSYTLMTEEDEDEMLLHPSKRKRTMSNASEFQ